MGKYSHTVPNVEFLSAAWAPWDFRFSYKSIVSVKPFTLWENTVTLFANNRSRFLVFTKGMLLPMCRRRNSSGCSYLVTY